MQTLNRSLTTSICSLGQGDCFPTEVPLPPDALVIVIQDRPYNIAELPLLQLFTYHRLECESLPVNRRNAEKAYSQQPRAEISIIYVSGYQKTILAYCIFKYFIISSRFPAK
jgi:hypothetical protein